MNQTIKNIGGEHNNLKTGEWEYLMKSFGFEGIPSYVIFDIKGELRHKTTGYPGNLQLQSMIENCNLQALLPIFPAMENKK